ncbi:MAG: PorT family protein [Bacteroidales bacterium]|nr:PorT family protein [Bacteroidales bacterium]
MTDSFNHMDELFRDGLKNYHKSKPSEKVWKKISSRLTLNNLTFNTWKRFWVVSGIAMVGLVLVFVLIKPVPDKQTEKEPAKGSVTSSASELKESKTAQIDKSARPANDADAVSLPDEAKVKERKDNGNDDYQNRTISDSSHFSKKALPEDITANDHRLSNQKPQQEARKDRTDEHVTNNTKVDQPVDSAVVSINEQTGETNKLSKLNTNEIDSQDIENKVERNKHKINIKGPKEFKEPENLVNNLPEQQKKVNEQGISAQKPENNDADNISQKQSSTVTKRQVLDTVPDTSFPKHESNNNKGASKPEKEKKQHKISLITSGGVALTHRYLMANKSIFEEEVKMLNENTKAQLQPYGFIGLEYHFRNAGISTGLEYSSYKTKGEYKLDSLIIDTLHEEMNIATFQQLYYFEIPFIYHYYFRHKKYSFSVGSGFSLGILTGRTGKIYRSKNQTYTVRHLQALPFEKLNVFWHSRASFGRRVFDDFQINAELGYKQALMSVYSDEYDFSLKPYSISFGFSLRYYF